MDETESSKPSSSTSGGSSPPIGGEIKAPEQEKILPRKKIIQPLQKQTSSTEPVVVKPEPESPTVKPNESLPPKSGTEAEATNKAEATKEALTSEAPVSEATKKPAPTISEMQKSSAGKETDKSESSSPESKAPEAKSTEPESPVVKPEETTQSSDVKTEDVGGSTQVQGAESSEDYEVDISDRNWRKIGLIAGSIVLIIAVIVGAYFFLKTDASPENSEQVPEEVTEVVTPIELSFFEDTRSLMQFSDDEGKSWQAVTADTKITDDIWLRNNNTAATPTIVKADNTEFRLSYQTTVVVDSSTDKLIQLSLREGSVYVRRIGRPSEKIVITMENISSELKGNAMMVRETNELEQSFAFVGLVSDEVNDLNVEEGEQFTYEKNGGRKTVGDVVLAELKEDAFVGYNRSRDIETLELGEDEMGILFDLEPPPLSLTSPTNEDEFKIESGNETVSITFTGTSETDAQLTLSTNTDKKTKVTADDGGAFTIIISADETDTTFILEAQDRSGNTTQKTLSLTIVASAEIDLSAVALPGEGIKASWEFVKGAPSADGIRLLWSDEPEVDLPVTGDGVATARGPCGDLSYGYKQLAGTVVTADVCLQDGGEYYFRLCSFVAADNSCEALSNEVAVTAPVFSGE